MVYTTNAIVGLKRMRALTTELQSSDAVANSTDYANKIASELKHELTYLLRHKAISWDEYVHHLHQNELVAYETIEFIDSLRVDQS